MTKALLQPKTDGQRKWIPYSEKLRDPRWQKRKSEIQHRAGFRCQDCGGGVGTNNAFLNVHHKVYYKGLEPWEYEDKNLICVCENCHERRETIATQARIFFQDVDPNLAQELLLMIARSTAHPNAIATSFMYCLEGEHNGR